MKPNLVNCNNNKIDKPLVSPVKEERKKLSSIRNEQRSILRDAIEIKKNKGTLSATLCQ